MNWAEFRDEVERQMREKGIPQDTEILEIFGEAYPEKWWFSVSAQRASALVDVDSLYIEALSHEDPDV